MKKVKPLDASGANRILTAYFLNGPLALQSNWGIVVQSMLGGGRSSEAHQMLPEGIELPGKEYLQGFKCPVHNHRTVRRALQSMNRMNLFILMTYYDDRRTTRAITQAIASDTGTQKKLNLSDLTSIAALTNTVQTLAATDAFWAEGTAKRARSAAQCALIACHDKSLKKQIEKETLQLYKAAVSDFINQYQKNA